ncbi:MAG TPA: transcriptional regulator [Clostridiales bacterium]|nr:transcriptional regulator [Clostridiales bacterium]
MPFHEKLNLLMNITNTTNSILANAVSLDPSFVSRLRQGTRYPSKNENYIKPIAFFLAKHISEEYQQTALSDALNIPVKNVPTDVEALSDLIYKWFYDYSLHDAATVQGFIDTLTHPTLKKISVGIGNNVEVKDYSKSNRIDASVFYGIEGKQSAALEFLSLVANNQNPQTLLLFSDEDIEWLTLNPDFITRWSILLMQIASKGNKIKIIHTVGRDLSEMLSAIKQWLPLYMTGAIEPYYYPKKRDGVFQRTLFIAPDTAAVVSGSVGKKIDNTANFLFKDKKTILALADEFYNYFSLCRPLMKIFTSSETRKFFATLQEFEGEDSNTIITTDTLSTITMPSGIFNSIFARTKTKLKNDFLFEQELRVKNFEESLLIHKFTETINMPDLEEIRLGKIKIAFSDMFSETQLFYTIEEFISHLENIIRLLKEYKNFYVSLKTDYSISGFMLYVKEDVGVLVAKSSMPTVMFAINESNLTAAFWDYLEPIIRGYSKSPSDKINVIAKLEEAVRELRSR